jgi:hypothetical protein
MTLTVLRTHLLLEILYSATYFSFAILLYNSNFLYAGLSFFACSVLNLFGRRYWFDGDISPAEYDPQTEKEALVFNKGVHIVLLIVLGSAIMFFNNGMVTFICTCLSICAMFTAFTGVELYRDESDI